MNAPHRTGLDGTGLDRAGPLLWAVGGFEVPRSFCNFKLSVARYVIVLVCLAKTKRYLLSHSPKSVMMTLINQNKV